MPNPKSHPRVDVLRPALDMTSMQVCAVRDASNEEILRTCNADNPSGSGGWRTVIRRTNKHDPQFAPDRKPVACEQFPDRLHLVVLL